MNEKMLGNSDTAPPERKRLKRNLELDQNQASSSSNVGCCGICLSDQWTASRGKLDSCDHSFCFVCILEWAKIETRCPICKRRFSSIFRPPKPGVLQSERLVHVRRRDQGSFLQEGDSDNFYEQIRCTVCEGSGDDCFLLLCDLCDSASHTFCVGLGSTVPEGDWYCSDCSEARAEYNESQGHNIECSAQPVISPYTSFRKLENIPDSDKLDAVDNQNVSIFDIVRGPDQGYASRKRSSMGTATEGARPLTKFRNVQSSIKSLRDNWDGLRSGCITFSSCTNVSVKVLDTAESSSSNSGCAVDSKGCPYNVDKAWRMMDKAIPEYNRHSDATRVQPSLKCPIASKNSTSTGSFYHPRTQVPSCSNTRNLNGQNVWNKGSVKQPCLEGARRWHLGRCSSKAVQNTFSSSSDTCVTRNANLLCDHRQKCMKSQTTEDTCFCFQPKFLVKKNS